MEKFKPTICPVCHQTMTYAISLDRGAADILRAVSVWISKKGVNIVHPRKEMESKFADPANGLITSIMVGNIKKLQAHGLVAKVKGNPGNYCMTTKGSRFLKGDAVPRTAIISKVEGHQIGYLANENGQTEMVTISDFIDERNWEGINFTIVEGHVVNDLPEKVPGQQALFLTPALQQN